MAHHHAVRSSWLVIALVHASACVPVEGGAVELSWKLRPASSELPDKFVECNSGLAGTNPVTGIRLYWDVAGETGSESWRCDDNHGVTGFDLPEGSALLSIAPECASGPASPLTYTAPAPEKRRVISGDTVSLGAVEVVLRVSYCGQQPCICE